jgi:hypothetical protein
MSFEVAERVHIAPLGIEYDRIVQPLLRTDADRVVLLDYLPAYLTEQLRDDQIEADLDSHGIEYERNACDIDDLFDALAAFGEAILEYESDAVYVNLATGDKMLAIGGMIACMTTEAAEPYYVEAEQHGSHQPPVPTGVRSVDTLPRYPMERPDVQHLHVMNYIANSDRTTADGKPYRIKRELFEFGEGAELPFIADYDGETNKGKFRKLDRHVVKPLGKKGYIDVEEVGTKKWVTLTEDGENTLRAFRYLLD